MASADPPERADLSARPGFPRERWALRRVPFVHAVRELTILPAGAAPPLPTVVGLHGMAMRVEIFARWLSGLADEPWAFVLPEGPYPLERRAGALRMIGHAWYLWEGDTPGFRRSLRRSERHVLRLLQRPVRRLPLDPNRRILLGFSQGGYFAGSLGLRHAERFTGIAVAGARIRPAYADRDLRGVRRLPILFLHGEEDDVVRLEDARASARELEDLGFPVTFRPVPGGHRWGHGMTEAFRDWAGRLFRGEAEGSD